MYSLQAGSLLFSPAFGQIRLHVNMPKIVPLLLQKNYNRTYRKSLTRGVRVTRHAWQMEHIRSQIGKDSCH